MGTIIDVEGLIKRFGDLAAVDGVSFSIAEGEIFGLLGPKARMVRARRQPSR